MLSFLKDANISDKTIKYMEENYIYEIAMSLEANQYECKKIITLLRRLGIKNVEELLKYEPDVFIRSAEDLAEKFKKFDIKEKVEDINEDYVRIEDVIYN